MKLYKKFLLLLIQSSVVSVLYAQKEPLIVSSPDKKIQVQIGINPSREMYYSVLVDNQLLLKPSKLGLVSSTEDYTKNIKFSDATNVVTVKDSYELFTG